MVISPATIKPTSMTPEFYKHIFDKQKKVEAVPPNEHIAAWTLKIIGLLFPERSDDLLSSVVEVETEFTKLESQLTRILNATAVCNNCDNAEKSKTFFNNIPKIYKLLNNDIEATLEGDPAAKARSEVIRAYPGFYAICFYRIAHNLLKLDIELIPRIITEYAHSKTGIDIHPGAEIGEHFFIDHGTGIVIGETCVIGDHVKLYQGVTLGALSVDKSMAYVKRHPTVEDHVIIYSGATILGGKTVIGSHSIIGGNVWLTKSIPPHSTVYHRPDIEVVEQIKS
jgi:serine O-acetyltransferase